MKLNPPASSSDLEAAREIARRLHQRRRRADLDRGERRPSAEPPRTGPPVARAAAAAPEPAAPRFAPPPPGARPMAARVHEPDEPEPPSWDDTEADEPERHEEHLAGALDDLTGDGEAPVTRTHPPAADEPVSAPPAIDALSSFDEEEAESLAVPPEPDLPGIDVEDGAVSPDEMVGAADENVDVEFEEPLSGADLEAPAAGAAEAVAALGPTEDLFDEPPPPPSWDDVVESCRDVAGATGAMIIDPAGQVFAARGEWPEPGPDAIAGRLVAMMERTLKDAPTRSVSAPVGGQHLTAWRVPLAEGLVTAAFIADSPLRSEVRSAIDAEIHRGAGA